MTAALVCLLCERCGFRSIPPGTPDALCNPCRGHARPLDYAGRCQRYAAQRGWDYDENRKSGTRIRHLTPRQRRRALKKENSQWIRRQPGRGTTPARAEAIEAPHHDGNVWHGNGEDDTDRIDDDHEHGETGYDHEDYP